MKSIRTLGPTANKAGTTHGETTHLVGTKATAAWRISMLWRNTRRIGSDAARLFLLVLVTVFACCLFSSTVVAQNISNEAIRVSGDSACRWNIGDAQALLFEGECVLQHEGSRLQAKSVLMVSDGPQGKVRTRLVIDGVPGRQSDKPIAATIFTIDDPIVQSPRYRRPPQTPPALLKFLPDLNPATQRQTGKSNTQQQTRNPVAQVQFQTDVPIQPSIQPSVGGLPQQLTQGPSDLPVGGFDVDSLPGQQNFGQPNGQGTKRARSADHGDTKFPHRQFDTLGTTKSGFSSRCNPASPADVWRRRDERWLVVYRRRRQSECRSQSTQFIYAARFQQSESRRS